jgi:hypothetical protein
VRLAGFKAQAKIEALADSVFTAWKDDDQIGEWLFPAGAKIAIPELISGAVAKDQFVGVRGPAVPDLQLADITFLITEG